MNQVVFEVAHSPGLWIAGCIVLAVVVVQAILYVRLAFKTAPDVDLTTEDCKKSIRTGVIVSIGPALAIFVIMMGTMSMIGSPLAWINTTLIGSVATDLVGANVGATAVGEELGNPESYTVMGLASSQWTMAINGIGFMVVALIFTRKFEALREKMGGGDPKWLAILSIAATLGIFGFLLTPHAIGGAVSLTAVLASGVLMFFLMKIAKKVNWLKEYALGFATLAGIIGGAVAASVAGV